MTSALQGIQEVVMRLFSTKGVEVFKKALDGEIENEIQFQAAKTLLVACLGEKSQAGTPVNVYFGGVPRPKEVDAASPPPLLSSGLAQGEPAERTINLVQKS